MTNSQHFLAALEQAKLDAMKELAYGASHEINNPLANISARAQTLLRDEADPERRRALEAIHHQALRAHEMISDLMLFARPPRLERRVVDVTALLNQIQTELRSESHRREVAWHVNVAPPPLEVTADAAQLAVALKALCVNALEAVGRGGRLNIQASLADDGGAAIISVADDGPGIPADVRPHVFDPFFSGRHAGRGLGFGLSKCWRIITDHGGRVAVEEADGRGARFTVWLPLTSGAGPGSPA